MAIRNIVKQGDPLLAKKTRLVETFDGRLHTLIDDMIQTMEKADGVGIAAPQVGILRRVVIVSPDPETVMTLVNPEILTREGEIEGLEGCLSIPETWGIVNRPERITVKAQDRDGEVFRFQAEGYAARVICHEVDHLEGVLFTEKAIRFIDPAEMEADEDEEA